MTKGRRECTRRQEGKDGDDDQNDVGRGKSKIIFYGKNKILKCKDVLQEKKNHESR